MLDSFVDLSKEECVDLVQRNLNINEIADAGVYEVSLQIGNPQDVATILNNLVDQYRRRTLRDS